MTFHGTLTALLKPEHVALGYSLSEDVDFLYVHFKGRIVHVFNARKATIEAVEAEIEKDC